MKFQLLEAIDNEQNELTKQQEHYFKNSIVRDENDNLLVCYHGTEGTFDTFRVGAEGMHFGNIQQAKRRSSKNLLKVYLNITHPLYVDGDMTWWSADYLSGLILYEYLRENKDEFEDIDYKQFYHPEYPSILNLYDLSLSNNDIGTLIQIWNDSTDNRAKNWMPGYNWNVDYNKHPDDAFTKNAYRVQDGLYKFLLSKGIDGIVYPNSHESEDENDWQDSYCAFKPNQIKSIDNLNPTTSDNIYK